MKPPKQVITYIQESCGYKFSKHSKWIKRQNMWETHCWKDSFINIVRVWYDREVDSYIIEFFGIRETYKNIKFTTPAS